ncbi:MAG: thioredoxin domain-containing protein [Alphaproteobacteria bacterium]|nr:thioredoxin domain-containing protein [Alphaproteobacteria bacterium]
MPRTASRLAALAVAACFLWPAAPSAQTLSPQQRGEVEAIIRDYLKRNPEFLIEVLQAAEEKQQAGQLARARDAIAAERKALTESPGDPVGGNPKGDVTLIEFFDYRCPYCKQVKPVVEQVLSQDRNVRVVYKEFPILGRDSVYASRAALAAHRQGKYLAYHHALMAYRGQLTEEAVLTVAKSSGLDVERLKREMQAPSVEAVIAANHQIAEKIGIRGTPAFIVGGELAPGAIDAASLKAMIDKARKG